MTLAHDVLARAPALGFDLVGFAPIGSPEHLSAFAGWLAVGYHGEMTYMAKRPSLRADPGQLSPGARTIIVVGANYHPGPAPQWDDPSRGRFARYAWAADYHDVIKSRLYELDAFIRERTGRAAPGKACVDTAPLLERDFAAQAGLGFIGRNTCLITPGLGSWTFLGALLVPESLEGPPTMHDSASSSSVLPGASLAGCGRCTRCLDACPTGALVAPYVLDARRCISYLTVELRGLIPRALRGRMGNWVFGCDSCQEVCPYNRLAPAVAWPALQLARIRAALPLLELLSLGEVDFRARFRGTSVLRAKRRGLVRNACVAAGNCGDPASEPLLAQLLEDPEPTVRGHAAWALGRIGGAAASAALLRAAASETDPCVRDEISAARGG
jgi:epoxyqueuosine reductase